MSLTNIILNSPLSAANLKPVMNLTPGGTDAVNNLATFITGIAGGLYPSSLSVNLGAVQASGTLIFASTGPTNGQQTSILNVLFTAVTSGATGNQFNINATPLTVATNLANAINASPQLAGKVTATVATVTTTAVVTITAVVPGLMGNGLNLDEGSLSNVTKTAMAGGTDGTSYSIDLL